MQNLKSALAAAQGEGIISAEQAERLVPYLEALGIGRAAPAAELPGQRQTDLSAPRDGGGAVADTEAPRFIRGFHDVLITIGIVIALAGIWGIGSFIAALPAIIILAEILVRRQRLALPAVALTIAYVQWVVIITAILVGDHADGLDTITGLLLFALPCPLLLIPFHWRYRIPLALGLLVTSGFVLLLALVFAALSRIAGDPAFVEHHGLISSAIFLVVALGLFAVAMWFDLADRHRVTRRSDVAFWLHLGAAPALLYAMLSFLFLDNFGGNGLFDGTAGAGDAVAVVLIVILFMAIGLVIDRRAFVTSGLLSMGLAIARIFRQTEATIESYVFATLLLVGLVVLTIGIGWPHFRRATLRLLPETLKTKLPPLR